MTEPNILMAALQHETRRADANAIAARRYEFVRTLDPYTFALIFQRVLAGEDFDKLIDAHIEGEARVRTKEGY